MYNGAPETLLDNLNLFLIQQSNDAFSGSKSNHVAMEKMKKKV